MEKIIQPLASSEEIRKQVGQPPAGIPTAADEMLPTNLPQTSIVEGGGQPTQTDESVYAAPAAPIVPAPLVPLKK
jgi:hypothetical protein